MESHSVLASSSREARETSPVPDGQELSEQQQNELVLIFCGSKPIDPAEVQALVSGKPGDVVGPSTFFPQNGISPFLEAARAGKLASLQFMLERYPNAIDVNGRGIMEQLVTAVDDPYTEVHCHVTALIAACFETSESEEVKIQVVKYLVSKGALVNVASCYGSTPLMAAAETGHVKVLQHLVQCGAVVNAVSVRGATALHHAACKGSKEAIKCLIRMGAHVNHQDHYGMCAIHTAAQLGKREAVDALISRGASTLSSQGHPADPKYVPSPILLAASEGHLEVVKDLQKHCSCNLHYDAYLMYAVWRYEQRDKSRPPSCIIPFFKEAFDLRAKCSDPTEKLPPCAAYGNQTEIQSLEQCHSLQSKEWEYQSLIIRERCFGIGNSALRLKMLELATHYFLNSSHVEAVSLLSRVMLSITSEVDNIPIECIAHKYTSMLRWDLVLAQTPKAYDDCSSKDKQDIDLTYFLQFVIHGLEYVKSSILKLSCIHDNSRDNISMLTLHGLRFLCMWLQQERIQGRDPLQGGSEHGNIGKTFTTMYLHAPKNSTLLCQALSPELYENLVSCFFIKDLVEDLVSALLHWGADTAIDDPCITCGQRPLHMAAEHHSHQVVHSLIEAGAHLDAVNRDGKSVLDIAIKWEDPTFSNILSSPLPLYCQVSRFIATSDNFPYKKLHYIPANMKAFIALHDSSLPELQNFR